MLLFLDESYEFSEAGSMEVLAGFAVRESRYGDLLAAVERAKAKYFVQDRQMKPEERERLWDTHFIVGDAVEKIEIKASLLLSSAVLRRTKEHPRAAVKLALALLDAIADAGGAAFAANGEKGETLILLRRVLAKTARWAEGEVVVPFLDHLNPTADRELSRGFSRAMMEAPIPKVLPALFVGDSKAIVGLQLADLISHLALNDLRDDDRRKPLQMLSERLHELMPQED